MGTRVKMNARASMSPETPAADDGHEDTEAQIDLQEQQREASKPSVLVTRRRASPRSGRNPRRAVLISVHTGVAKKPSKVTVARSSRTKTISETETPWLRTRPTA